jgi:hypothetical protein
MGCTYELKASTNTKACICPVESPSHTLSPTRQAAVGFCGRDRVQYCSQPWWVASSRSVLDDEQANHSSAPHKPSSENVACNLTNKPINS